MAQQEKPNLDNKPASRPDPNVDDVFTTLTHGADGPSAKSDDE